MVGTSNKSVPEMAIDSGYPNLPWGSSAFCASNLRLLQMTDLRRDSKFRRGKWSQVQSLSSPIQFQYDLGLELSPKNTAQTEVIGCSSNRFSCYMKLIDSKMPDFDCKTMGGVGYSLVRWRVESTSLLLQFNPDSSCLNPWCRRGFWLFYVYLFFLFFAWTHACMIIVGTWHIYT